jgi:thioesterase domain-containing protein
VNLNDQPRQKTSAAREATEGDDLRTALQAELDQSIPLTRAMQLKVSAWSAKGLTLMAPLAPNINDKGSAFGGSLSAMLTLAGWGLLWLRTKQSHMACDLVIHRGEIRYVRPVTGPIIALCPQPGALEWQLFADQFASRGKARIRLRPVVLDSAGQEAVTFQSEFVALKRN